MEENNEKKSEEKEITNELMNFGKKISEMIEALGETPVAKEITKRLNFYLEELKQGVKEIKENPSEEIRLKLAKTSKTVSNEMIKGLQYINEKIDSSVEKIKKDRESNS